MLVNRKKVRNNLIWGARNLGILNQPENAICHFSFHKNLTVYYRRVAAIFARKTYRTHRHFSSLKAKFESSKKLDIRSVNNHFIDLDKVLEVSPNTRFSLFVRDPRDLVVSGYYYHRRGAEGWCNITNPTVKSLETVNMKLSSYLQKGESIATCLQRLSPEDGLRMEIELREPHFETLRLWSSQVASRNDLLSFKYEEILQDEAGVFAKLADHYSLNNDEKKLWIRLAEQFSAGKVQTNHIRNPDSGQWREMFSNELASSFEAQYGDILEAFSY